MDKHEHENAATNGRERVPQNIDPLTNQADRSEVNNVNEEMAADYAVGASPVYGAGRSVDRSEAANREEEDDGTRSGGYAIGWVALTFAIASWFIWPVLLGATAAVIGYLAYRQGARGLGGWSMAIGLTAVVLYLVIVPFYYAIT